MSSDQDVKKFKKGYLRLIEEQKQEKKKEIRLKQIREPKEGETINDTDTPRPEIIEKLKQERKKQFTQLYQAVIEKREKEQKQEQIEDLQGRTGKGDPCKKEEEQRANQEQQKARKHYEEMEEQAEEECLKAIAEDETLRAILGLDEGADAETIRAAIEKFFKKENRKTREETFEGTDHSDRINDLFTSYDNLLKNKPEPSIKTLVEILNPSKPTTIHLGSLSPGNG